MGINFVGINPWKGKCPKIKNRRRRKNGKSSCGKDDGEREEFWDCSFQV